MVAAARPSVYLFTGEDTAAKDQKLAQLKAAVVSPALADFNCDILYARDLSLKKLQEKMLFLPAGGGVRLVVIRDAEHLGKEEKAFLVRYAAQPAAGMVLVLDVQHRGDEFAQALARFAQVASFRETVKPDTFALSRQIEGRHAAAALRMLRQLLDDGEKPERILGGLRYAWERGRAPAQLTRKRLQVLLECDSEIKTGRMSAEYALERLVVRLSGLAA